METEWIELDVRPMLAEGREPFALIMNHIGTLEKGQGLRLVAPFFPQPLISMLEGQGWRTESAQVEGADWEVRIRRTPEEVGSDDIELDLRDLPPPEPMERILQALPGLEKGQRLVARTPFYPGHLIPMLEERGFAWESVNEAGEQCRITIYHR